MTPFAAGFSQSLTTPSVTVASPFPQSLPTLPINQYQSSPTKFKTVDAVLKVFGYPGPMARINVKKIALGLVRDTFFEPEQMKRCTVGGKKKVRLQLGPLKMDQIKGIVRKVCERETDADFEILWEDTKRSIGQACKNLHRKLNFNSNPEDCL